MTRAAQRSGMGLSAAFKDAFLPDVRARGRDYFEEGRVRDLLWTPEFVDAVVDGTRPYVVTIDRADRAWPGECSCEAFDKWGPCKHLWATMLAFDARTPGVAGRGEEVELDRRLKRLLVAEEPRTRDPWAAIGGAVTRIEYCLEQVECLAHGMPVVRVALRKRKANGEWGARAPFRHSRRDGGVELANEDRSILAILHLLEDPGRRTYLGYWDDDPSSRKLHAAELCDVVLPRIAETGRLVFIDRAQRERTLAWDPGLPWRFALSREERAGKGGFAIRGRLEREGERMTLDEPEILFSSGYLVARGVLARFDPRGAMRWVVDLRERGELLVPAGVKSELEEALVQSAGEAWQGEARSAVAEEALRAEVAVARPVPHLRLDVPSDPARSRLVCRVGFDYGAAQRVAPEDAALTVVRKKDGARVQRDLEFEGRALAAFLAAGAKRGANAGPASHGTVAVRHLSKVVRALIDQGWSVEAEGKLYRTAGEFDVSVRSGMDWFELEGGLDFDGQVAPLPELLAAARDGRREVRLGDGSFGVLPEDWLRSWGLVTLAEKKGGDALRFGANQGWLLDALLAGRTDVSTDAGFEAYRARLRGFSGIEAGREPRGFRGELRPYQRDALGWFAFLRELGFGGCLADDMGLGKTVQVLALLEERRIAQEESGGEVRPSLVVAPRSLVFNWIGEAERFTPELRVVDYTGTDRNERREAAGEAHLLVTTYGTLRREATRLAEVDFDYVVLDEATAIKNGVSLSAKAARLMQGRHRLALSGTPVENHLGELWSLFEFLNPGMLGRSKAFQAFAKDGAGGGELGALGRALRPFFLRRTKEDVLTELPPKSEQVIHCELGKKERKRYDELRDHFRSLLLTSGDARPDDALGSESFQVLEALLRLRQCACHPALLDPDRADEGSAKLDVLLPRLEELVDEGHKVLVFSQFTSFLRVVRERLDRAGLVYEYLDGSTRNRKERVERFQSDPACPLFLISLKAGGHGLNLTAADYVFLLDPWWNPAIESQAVDRAHRMGQENPVFAYRLIAKDTVEEKVLELQAEKRELAQAVLGGGSSALRDLTRADLDILLS